MARSASPIKAPGSLLAALFLLFPACAFGAVASTTEEDGTPDCYGWQQKFSNGSITDNGDGTCSVSVSGTTTTGWTDDGASVSLTTNTDNVSLGTDTAGGKLFIDGDTDEIQLQVQGNATQTALPLVVEQSDGTDVFTVSNAGAAVSATLDTGQGANELYDMNQNVQTTDSPTFADVTSADTSPTFIFDPATGNTWGWHLDPGGAPFWLANGSTRPLLVDANDNVYISGLPNCDSVDTNSQGRFVCGVDAGTGGNTFETISVPAGTNPVADSTTDTLTITETSPLVITGTAGTDTIDITMTTSPSSAATVVGTGRSLTMTGTANQITLSAGAQDLSADRTWTFSTPQDIATTSDVTFSNLNLAGTGPEATLEPTSGDKIGFHAEYAAATGTIFTLRNSTDGVPYFEIGNTHALTLGSASVPFIQLVTGSNNDIRLMPGSVDVTELNTMTSGQFAGRLTDETGTGTFLLSSTLTKGVGVSNQSGNQTTASAVLATLPGSSATLVTSATNPIAVWFLGQCRCDDATCVATLNISVDGTRIIGSSGVNFDQAVASEWMNCNLAAFSDPVAAGSHTIAVEFSRQTAGTLTMSAGGGTPAITVAKEFTD